MYPSTSFTQAVNKIADWIEADITVNQGGFEVYVGEIKSSSFQTNIINPIQVPAITSDEVEPTPIPTYTPTSGQNGYQAADIQATRDAMNKQTHTNWQNQIKNNHTAVTSALNNVKEALKKLRALRLPYDNKAADVYGCLADASQQFHNTPEVHYLIIASAFVNNTSVNKAPDINLSHAHVRAIYRDCSEAPLCAEHDTQWKNNFIQMGVDQDVTFYDPQQSELLPPLF